MSREQERDKKLLENLDRILAGEETKTDETADSDTRATLEFAQKMASIRSEPSPAFKAHLRATLVEKMYEEGARANQGAGLGWLWRLTRQPVWQALSVFVIIVAVSAVLWGMGIFDQPGQEEPGQEFASTTTAPEAVSSPPSLTAPTAPKAGALAPAPNADAASALLAEATTDKSVYQPGETVRVNVVLANNTGTPVTFEQFPPLLSLIREDSAQAAQTFPAGADSRTLAPGDTASFGLVWDQKTASGSAAPTGGYYVELEDIDSQGKTLRLVFTQPARFDILPAVLQAAGTALRTITVNQISTVADVTVNLERVVLFQVGFSVHAFISPPPAYIQGTDPPRPLGDYKAMAQYHIDLGWKADAGNSSVEYLTTGARHTWFIPQPLPSDATEMLFVITRIGDTAGEWRFTIPLQ